MLIKMLKAERQNRAVSQVQILEQVEINEGIALKYSCCVLLQTVICLRDRNLFT